MDGITLQRVVNSVVVMVGGVLLLRWGLTHLINTWYDLLTLVRTREANLPAVEDEEDLSDYRNDATGFRA